MQLRRRRSMEWMRKLLKVKDLEEVLLSQQEALEGLNRRLVQLEEINAQLREKVADLASLPHNSSRGVRASTAVRQINRERLKEMANG
jgi:uncharacterized coiled-coil protein SlyX